MAKVLVVDDDLSVRASMKKVLQGAGYEVLLAATGQEALNQLGAQRVDLLLLDMNLPLRSGPDILEQIRAKDANLPIITLSAYAQQYRSKASARASALMEKPLDASKLLEVIRWLLGNPQKEQRREKT